MTSLWAAYHTTIITLYLEWILFQNYHTCILIVKLCKESETSSEMTTVFLVCKFHFVWKTYKPWQNLLLYANHTLTLNMLPVLCVSIPYIPRITRRIHAFYVVLWYQRLHSKKIFKVLRCVYHVEYTALTSVSTFHKHNRRMIKWRETQQSPDLTISHQWYFRSRRTE